MYSRRMFTIQEVNDYLHGKREALQVKIDQATKDSMRQNENTTLINKGSYKNLTMNAYVRVWKPMDPSRH